MLIDVVISHADLKKEPEGLNCFKSIGPDNIHPKLLRSLADDSNFIFALAKLFCVIIDTGKLPNIWKSANLTALFKKGSKTDPLNYRPVSLTCIICKVFEKIVRSSIATFVETKISYHQHGFVKGKSCLTNLLETMDSILEILDQGSPVDILYFDFKKAFDRVPHNRLLLKLKCLGIEGKLLNTIKHFLTNRTFRACVKGQFSSIKEVLSGIRQGSVLGPLLFVLYINDLPDYVENKAKLLADDLKLIANAAKRKIIDDDLRKLEQWERTWLLEFNLDKCKVMHLGFNNNQKLSYILDNSVLESCKQEKDLGVLTSVNILWNNQISSCISKANQMICWIAQSIISREKSPMLRVYKTLVRSHLEYCVQLWNLMPEHGNWVTIIKIEGSTLQE